MESRQAAEEFCELFRKLYLTFYQRHPPSERQPSPETLAVLQHLAVTGPLTVGEAAWHFARSQAATSELVARLERRGLVDRAADKRDRRRHLIWLTPEGLRVWRRSTQVLSVGRLEEAFAGLSKQGRREVLEALRTLIAPRHDNRTGGG